MSFNIMNLVNLPSGQAQQHRHVFCIKKRVDGTMEPTTLSADFWEKLTEDDVWALATDLNCPLEVREAAMRRWLFPEEYGFDWARDRINSVREVLRKQHLTQAQIEKRAA
jgi:hypothetical protein